MRSISKQMKIKHQTRDTRVNHFDGFFMHSQLMNKRVVVKLFNCNELRRLHH